MTTEDEEHGTEATPPAEEHKGSVSAKQADMMQHVAHSPEYAEKRSMKKEVGDLFFNADVRLGQWGKYEGCPCPKCGAEKGGSKV